MASDRKLIVAVIGDDSSFQKALARSTAAAKAFGTNVSRAMTPRGDLFKKFGMQGQVDDLRSLAAEIDKTNDSVDRAARTGGQGFATLAGKAGLVGLAVTTAYQASRRLADALETTGKEAFTTGGRLKNMGAAAVQGDLLGVFSAATRTAGSIEEMGFSAYEAKQRLSDLEDAAADAGLSLTELGRELDKAGSSNSRLLRELRNMVASLEAAENAADALADSTARLGTVFRTSTGEAVMFKGAVDDLGGLRGPGLADQINANLEQARGGAQGLRSTGDLGPTARNANAQIIAAANGDLAEVLRLQVIERERLREAVANSRASFRDRQALATEYAQAQAAVISTNKAIQSGAESAAKAAEAAAKAAAREAEANRKAAAARREALREAARAAEQARQFRALGLTAEGNRPPPTIANLLKQITQLGKTDLSKNERGVLARIRKVLVDPLRKATPETRAAAKGLIDGIRDELDVDKKLVGPLTKTTSLRANKLIEGLGLGPEQIRELRARLSSFNSAGMAVAGTTRPTGTFRGGDVIETHTTVNLDGQVVGKSVTRAQQKNRKRNPVQKRGSRRGGV